MNTQMEETSKQYKFTDKFIAFRVENIDKLVREYLNLDKCFEYNSTNYAFLKHIYDGSPYSRPHELKIVYDASEIITNKIIMDDDGIKINNQDYRILMRETTEDEKSILIKNLEKRKICI